MVSIENSDSGNEGKVLVEEEEISSKLEAVEILSGSDDGEEEVFIDDEQVNDLLGEKSFSLIGRVLTQRRINLGGLRRTLGPVWGSPEGFCIDEVAKGIFHFSFHHEKDRERILQGRSWLFKNQLLVLSSWDPSDEVDSINLNFSPLWIQFWDIPPRFCSEKVVRSIGAKLGEILGVRLSKRATDEGRFVRLKVVLDVRKVLLISLKANLGSLGSFVIKIKYENLPLMCFYCGVLGHDNEACERKELDLQKGV